MADGNKANSNLDLQAEPTEVMSLVDKLEETRMGERQIKRHKEAEARATKHRKLSVGGDEMARIQYVREIVETLKKYEEDLIFFLQEVLGDENRGTVCMIGDKILDVLKTDHLNEQEKKREIEIILGSLAKEKFALLVNLGKKITDFEAEEKVPATGETCGNSVQFEEPEEEDEKEGDRAIHDESTSRRSFSPDGYNWDRYFGQKDKKDEYVKVEDCNKMLDELEKRMNKKIEEILSDKRDDLEKEKQ